MPNSNQPAQQTEPPIKNQEKDQEKTQHQDQTQASNPNSDQKKEQKEASQPKKGSRVNSNPEKKADDKPYQYPDIELERSRVAPNRMKPLVEKTILQWEAPNRPFKKRDKKYFSTILIIAALVALILFFAGQVLPVAVVVAIVFLIYVLSVTPPQNVTNELTTYGVRVEDQLHYWDELGRFWFTEQFDETVLNIETIRFPGRVTLLLPENIDKEDMRVVLSEVLLNQRPEPTLYENVASWLKEKIPLDE